MEKIFSSSMNPKTFSKPSQKNFPKKLFPNVWEKYFEVP
jgi:hypothetical protein